MENPPSDTSNKEMVSSWINKERPGKTLHKTQQGHPGGYCTLPMKIPGVNESLEMDLEVILLASSNTSEELDLRFQNALLAEPIPQELRIPTSSGSHKSSCQLEFWWGSCAHYMKQRTIKSKASIRRIWSRFSTYMQHFWRQKLGQIKKNNFNLSLGSIED
jgi:hypothetical protein